MSRLSLWKDGKHSNDYKFFDRRISEMFQLGGTGVLLHKYMGTNIQSQAFVTTSNATVDTRTLAFANVALFETGQSVSGIGIASNTVIMTTNVSANTVTISSNTVSSIGTGSPINVYWKDGTQPIYLNQSAQNIQDLLFLENRDRKYDTSIYKLRGIYNVNDNDFDLQQFGIFLSADTIMMTFHIKDTVSALGRKMISGDVLELEHLKDYYPLDAEIPAVLKRFYVIQDVTRAAEGYSPTWWPHLYRIKATPLVDSQEYKDILNNISAGDANNTPIGQILSTFSKLNQINDAIIQQAEIDVPKSGTNIDPLYNLPVNPDGSPGDPTGQTVDTTVVLVNSTVDFLTQATTPDVAIVAYLGGDQNAPDGYPVIAGTSFTNAPNIGDYCLRTDYVPNRLFRYDGTRWTAIQDDLRTNLTPGSTNQTQKSKFVNDNSTYTNNEGQTLPTRQSLSKALTPKADS